MTDLSIVPAPQAWTTRRFVYFRGQFDSKITTGEDYPTQALGKVFGMKPGDKPKGAGLAMIPSTFHDYNAREHSAQREQGRFIALTADIDSGDHPLAKIQGAIEQITAGAAWLVYTSPHARPGDMRWRVLIPLADEQPFEAWHDAQLALYAFLEAQGIECDYALARAAQPVYLPNVPAVHAKSETRLRGDDGKPLYYTAADSGLDKPGLPLDAGLIAQGIAALRHQRLEDEKTRALIRAEAERKRAAMPRGEGASLIEDFNAENTVAAMLEMCGYEQSLRNPDDWRSPHQTGETYATRVIGSKWVSLSASDAASGLGSQCAAGCYGDAYDLFVHFKHGGDHKAAFRALGAERRAAQGNVVYPKEFEPPEWLNAIPMPDEAPEWAEEGAQMEHDLPLAEEEKTELLPLFAPADWQGVTPPERQWRLQGFIPNYQATLLTGAGAAGKSLATQQMSTCIAMGLPFLGIETDPAPSLYITCEDDLEELHRRQEAICAGLGIGLDATRDRLFLLSLQGQIGNELATFDHEGRMAIASRYREIEATCLQYGIRHVTLDNTAHTFAGNENDRHQVAAFVNLNNKLAQAIQGSVVMVGHPNKAGDSYSGSTAWENQVRSRLYLEIPKGEEGAPLDPDLRVLRNEKANYSQRGAEVRFYWFKGAFITEEQMPTGNEREVRETAHMAAANALFLNLLDRLTEQRRHVSHSPNLANYAPRVMAAMPEAKGMDRSSFAKAMERLFNLGEIAASQPLWKGRDRHPVFGLARKKEAE